MNGTLQKKTLTAVQIGNIHLRRVKQIFKNHKYTLSEVIRESLRKTVLTLEGHDADLVKFLKNARLNDVSEKLEAELEVAQK
ncbi:MAG TPA: hypothetical protein ENH82_11885 [bacterium]|nr:hypothetical protein [bacterium]